MFKRALLIGIVFLASFSAVTIKQVINDTRLSIVKINFNAGTNDDGEPQEHVCTGFVVNASKGWVLTAKHCVPDDKSPVWVDGVESEIIREDDDLAIVSFPPMTRPPLDIAKDIDLGAEVLSFGFGYGDPHVVQRHLSAKMDSPTPIIKCRAIVLDGPIANGMSGGPMVDLNGKVVGINQASNNIFGIGCDAAAIRKFIREKK